MDNFNIETAQNISINQNVAHVTTRIGSFLIDVFILFLYSLSVILLLDYLLDIKPSMNNMAIFVFLGLPTFFYSLLCEMLMNGQTPGKRFNKIRVVKLDGSKATFANFVLRWMLRFFDIQLAVGSVAVVAILINGKGQRVGDIAAGTTIISEKKRIGLKNTLFNEIPLDYNPTYPQVTVLTDKDIQQIKTMYTEAKEKRNHGVITLLSNKVKEITQIKTEEKPIDFIATILSDYNYYTQQ